MKNPEIVYFGLSRLQIQTLYCHFPTRYKFTPINESFFENPDNIEQLVKTDGCVFINPKKLKTGQLQDILSAHELAKTNTHAAVILFTNPFTIQ